MNGKILGVSFVDVLRYAVVLYESGRKQGMIPNMQ